MLSGNISQDLVCGICRHDLRLVRDTDATLVWCPYCGVVTFWHQAPSTRGDDQYAAVITQAQRHRRLATATPGQAAESFSFTVRLRRRTITGCSAVTRAVIQRLRMARRAEG